MTKAYFFLIEGEKKKRVKNRLIYIKPKPKEGSLFLIFFATLKWQARFHLTILWYKKSQKTKIS